MTGKLKLDEGVHDPVGGGAEALALGADVGGEDLAEVDPDDGTLRDGEEDDEADEQREQQRLVAPVPKMTATPARADAAADGADEQEGLAAELVDEGDAEQGGEEIGAPMATAWRSAGDGWLKPALAKMSLR